MITYTCRWAVTAYRSPRWCGNILIVFLISGLWHGTNWTYVIWGGLHGLYIVLHRLTQGLRQQLLALAGIAPDWWPYQVVCGVTTFVLALVVSDLFRAPTVGSACEIIYRGCTELPGDLRAMAAGHRLAGIQPPYAILGLAGIAAFISVEALDRHIGFLFEIVSRRSFPIRFAVYSLLIYVPLVFAGFHVEQQFIYFQF